MVRDPRAGQVYCIIDGLDRCKEDSLRLLVGLIRNYFLKEAAEQDRYDNGYAQHEEPEATAYPQEREDVEGFDEEDEEDFNPSLKLYIEAKIKELPPNAPESLLTVALEHRGDGTFLWIDFAVEELKKVPVEMMEDTVNSLPPELDQMYTRILLNIPPELVEFVVGLLRWIVCARRPMDLLELAVALNLSHHSPEQASAT
ncbi:hypothetical protein M011DRAFT_392575, partial [Sporormia fimetaria CBS 119925]